MSKAAREALARVRSRSVGQPLDPDLRVTLNFHPDRHSRGRTVLEHLRFDRTYRSQFETGTSNGGLTAHESGARWRWERDIFGGAYDDALAAERPVYGALDHRRGPLGGAPRFGSAYLRLTPEVLGRTSFCFPDSVFGPGLFGTADACDLVRHAEEYARGVREGADEARDGGLLDAYVEAHVHGRVELARDVELLALDPCYRGTEVEEQARALPVPLRWHAGRWLTVQDAERHVAFRGPEAVAFARGIAPHGELDARVIGLAAAAGADPQLLKRVWHLVARYGRPRGLTDV